MICRNLGSTAVHLAMVGLLTWIALYAFDDTQPKSQEKKKRDAGKLPGVTALPTGERKSAG